jgi:hypothetical protein
MDAESRIEESHPAAGSALPITIRGGSGPICPMAPPLDAEWENGVGARSLAADAHGCIMVRIRDGIHRMQGCGATFAPE